MIDWGGLVESVLVAAVGTLLPVALGFLVAWLKTARDEMLSRLSSQQRYLVMEAVHIGVRAAEQSGLAGYIENKAAEKKRKAIDVAEAYLAQHGLEGLDLDVLADLIEAEVHKQFHNDEQH